MNRLLLVNKEDNSVLAFRHGAYMFIAMKDVDKDVMFFTDDSVSQVFQDAFGGFFMPEDDYFHLKKLRMSKNSFFLSRNRPEIIS